MADIGKYRTHLEPMLVLSGRVDNPKIHFEAPPSETVFNQMEKFINWFNSSYGKISPLIRCGLAHLYFVCIHPFEEGNGRIGHMLCEKILSQELNQATIISLSTVINQNKKLYYQKLEQNNQQLEITDWLIYFARTVLEAQDHTQKMIDKIIQKTQIFDQFADILNPRQIKVMNKLFDFAPDNFVGGLSNSNYISLTNTSIATATRDLTDLVDKKILTKTGDKRYARYYLAVSK